MRVACFSPLPPSHSGIADYTRELLPALAASVDVDLWIGPDQPWPRHVEGFTIVDYGARPDRLRELGGYDVLLFHLGNDARFHTADYRVFRDHPGVVVLHDPALHHFRRFLHVVIERRPELYVEEMEARYGVAGRRFAERVVAGEESLLAEVSAQNFPLHEEVLDRAIGVIVHSEFAAGIVRRTHSGLPLGRIQHFGKPLAPASDPAALRSRLGLSPDVIVFTSFGHLVPAKRIDVALRALERLERSDFVLLLIGEMPDPLRRQIEASPRRDNVRVVPWLDLEALNEYLRVTDVVVNLRFPTIGETSGAASRALAAGKPCVVSDVGWFSEMPDDCVVKIAVDGEEEERLAEALARLAGDAALRAALGSRALDWVRRTHALDQVAKQYVEFLESAAAVQRIRGRCLDETAADLQGLGVRRSDRELLAEVASSIASLFPPGGRRSST